MSQTLSLLLVQPCSCNPGRLSSAVHDACRALSRRRCLLSMDPELLYSDKYRVSRTPSLACPNTRLDPLGRALSQPCGIGTSWPLPCGRSSPISSLRAAMAKSSVSGDWKSAASATGYQTVAGTNAHRHRAMLSISCTVATHTPLPEHACQELR